MTDIQLFGRIFIHTNIKALTGLHIGGSSTGLDIGGVDKTVVRNQLDKRPYIPGSSLRGKMRSLTEKQLGRPQNNRIGQVVIHTCKNAREYQANGGCPVCHVFGVPAEMDFSNPTLLTVRDVLMTEDSATKLITAATDLLYTEIKTEVAIDRVTSAATPRNLERVPAGTVFGPAELVFNIYQAADFERLKVVLDALQLVEDDYLGGGGTRGNGKIAFQDIEIGARCQKEYGQYKKFRTFDSVQLMADASAELIRWARTTIPTGE